MPNSVDRSQMRWGNQPLVLVLYYNLYPDLSFLMTSTELKCILSLTLSAFVQRKRGEWPAQLHHNNWKTRDYATRIARQALILSISWNAFKTNPVCSASRWLQSPTWFSFFLPLTFFSSLPAWCQHKASLPPSLLSSCTLYVCLVLHCVGVTKSS